MHGISPWSLIPGWGIAVDQSHQIVDWGIDKLSSSQSNFQVPRRTLSTPLPAHPCASVLASPIFGFTVQKLPYRSMGSNFAEPLTPIPASSTGYVHTRSKMHWTKVCDEAWLRSGLKSTMLIVIFYKGQLRYQQHRKMVVWFLTSELDQLILYYGEIESNWNQNETPWEDVGPWAATSRCQGSPWLNHSSRVHTL